MGKKIIVREVPLEEALKVNETITEFGAPYPKESFEERYKGKEKLIIVAYLDGKPAGYMIGYDRDKDGSFYCWMAGVDPGFREKGAFKALMEYQEDWAKNKGYNKLKIKTRNNRREMLSYLVKHGFNFIEVVKKPKIEDNRITLEKPLIQPDALA